MSNSIKNTFLKNFFAHFTRKFATICYTLTILLEKNLLQGASEAKQPLPSNDGLDIITWANIAKSGI